MIEGERTSASPRPERAIVPSSPSTASSPPQGLPTNPAAAPGSSRAPPAIQLAVSVMPNMLKTFRVPAKRAMSSQWSRDSGAEPTCTRTSGRVGGAEKRSASFQNDGTELMKPMLVPIEPVAEAAQFGGVGAGPQVDRAAGEQRGQHVADEAMAEEHRQDAERRQRQLGDGARGCG